MLILFLIFDLNIAFTKLYNSHCKRAYSWYLFKNFDQKEIRKLMQFVSGGKFLNTNVCHLTAALSRKMLLIGNNESARFILFCVCGSKVYWKRPNESKRKPKRQKQYPNNELFRECRMNLI